MANISIERQHAHCRTMVFNGYLRSDGLWEIVGELVDTKPYVYPDRERGDLAPGQPIHKISIRLTCDDEMVVHSVTCEMTSIPFSICVHGADRLDSLIGAKLGAGWRRAIHDRMGGIGGCSHLRELLLIAATAAYQTISPYRETQGERAPTGASDDAPFFLNGCYSWAFESPVVARFFKQFHVLK